MGYGYSIACENCHYEKTFNLGPGFMSPNTIEAIILDNKNQKENVFLQYIHNYRNANLVENYGNKLYECPKCMTLHSKYYFEINYGEEETFVKQPTCGRCRGILVPASDPVDLSKIACKQCGEKQLTHAFMPIIKWD